MQKQIKAHLIETHDHDRLPYDESELQISLAPYNIVKSWMELNVQIRNVQGDSRVPMEFDGLRLYHGVQCAEQGCDHIRENITSLRNHYSRDHTPKLCPPEEALRKVYCQQLYKYNAPYFEVDCHQRLAHPPDETMGEMAQLIQETVNSLNRIDPDKKMREPWLLRVRWDEFVGNRDASKLVKYVAAPEGREFPALRDGLLLLADQMKGQLDMLSGLIKQRLNTEDPVKDG